MTDGGVLGADPAVLDAYAVDASGVLDLTDHSTTAYGVAWLALTTAPASPPLGAPCSIQGRVSSAVSDLRAASTSVQGYADALRALDADADGELDSGELPDLTYLDLFLQLRQEHQPHDTVHLDLSSPFFLSTAPETPAERLAHLKRETDRLYELSKDLVDVNNDGSNGEPREIRLNLNDPGILEGYSQEDVQEILRLHGIDGEDGPLHFLVHGFTTGTDPLESAGHHVATRYHERGEDDTTIVTVDWDSGSGPTDWNEARGNADPAAAALTRIFDALNASNPDADVKLSAHSLGNKVALNALTDMADDGGFQVDYLAIEPAIPRYGYEEDANDFGALVSDRIKTLTVTVNDGDDALNKYFDYGTIHALGEAEPGDDSIQDLIEARDDRGLSTTIVDHESGLGDEHGEGHLSLDPDMELNDDSDKEHDGNPLDHVYDDQIGR
ncbi:alpha/beta hydrolase [Aquihabitans sp. G128]|uniref:alpha/beta hydrolase n=1 Tax=Aquihabitans sp. G128 TaxID=2849779 RepID=UPI001C231053|nr:alpha/beta hydrolase [Aquihabitans sp. G128]QXC59284.1 alpha/beta hydrolase [Aquihabitans sp. G128]